MADSQHSGRIDPERGKFARFDAIWWDKAHARLAEAFGLSLMELSLLGELADHGSLERAQARLGA